MSTFAIHRVHAERPPARPPHAPAPTHEESLSHGRTHDRFLGSGSFAAPNHAPLTASVASFISIHRAWCLLHYYDDVNTRYTGSCIPGKYHNDYRYNITPDGRLVGDRSTCIVAKHGRSNQFGPLQLWFKPQPGNAAAVFIQNTGNTWGSHGQDQVPLTIELAELPGVDPSMTYKVRDIWKHADLPSITKELVTDYINLGDSRFYLLTPE